MKINKFLALVFIVASIGASLQFSCDKVKEKLSVNVGFNVAEITFDLPALPAADIKDTAERTTISLNLDSLIKAENSKLGTKNIRSVKIESCQFTIAPPVNGKSFGDLASLKLSLAAGGANDWITLASISDNPLTTATSLTLPVNDVELKPYFVSNQFSYLLEASGRKAIPSPTTVKAAIKFKMEVGL